MASFMPRLMTVERDKKPCWGCCSSDADEAPAVDGAAAVGRAAAVGKTAAEGRTAAAGGAAAVVGKAPAAVIKAGGCLLMSKQCCAQENCHIDDFAQRKHQ